jgi:hypothetical protein
LYEATISTEYFVAPGTGHHATLRFPLASTHAVTSAGAGRLEWLAAAAGRTAKTSEQNDASEKVLKPLNMNISPE